MASKYFLVFKGKVDYCPRNSLILCRCGVACFYIFVSKKVKVMTRGSKRYTHPVCGNDHFLGNELWANGSRYWIKLSEGGDV